MTTGSRPDEEGVIILEGGELLEERIERILDGEFESGTTAADAIEELYLG